MLSTANANLTFKQAMGNPENWLTAYRHNLWGMREGLEARYDELSIGDVVLFRTDREFSDNTEWGIIGYGVVGRKSKKDKPLWPDELEVGAVLREPLLEGRGSSLQKEDDSNILGIGAGLIWVRVNIFTVAFPTARHDPTSTQPIPILSIPSGGHPPAPIRAAF